MKKILILNGSPRKKGTTASLIKAFTEGAEAAGNEVKELYIEGMNIHGCRGCEVCAKNGGQCVQKDDMAQVNEATEWADVVVLASPMFFGTITAQLKTVLDRWYATFNKLGWGNFKKETALLMTARGDSYQIALDFYGILVDMLGWKDWGRALGRGKEDEARAIGASIK